MSENLHIRETLYGPSIYLGRKKLEGPFKTLLGPMGAKARLEVLMDRSSPHHWLPIGRAIRVDGKLYRPSSISESGNRYFHFEGKIVEHLVGGGVAVKFENYPNTVDYTRREAEKFQTLL